MAVPILTLLVWIPFLGFVVTLFAGTTQRRARSLAMGFSLVATGIAVFLTANFLGHIFDGWFPASVTIAGTTQTYAYVEEYTWVPTLGISYVLGLDGLSLALVLLTPLLTTLAIGFSWDKDYRPKEFFALLLLMEWSITGVFVTLDFLLFFVFWELVLIPMFFLIGIWGGPNRHYASIKFLIYTHVGSVIMLLSIFAMYLTLQGPGYLGTKTFNMIRIQEYISNHLTGAGALQLAFQVPVFLAFFFGFIVKLPSVPFHTWWPDAHVEAPTAGSVILAGLLLKMGGYGIFRVALPMLPDAARYLWWVMAIFGVVSMIYASLVCLAQVDLKKLIAYSSIGHMGFVLLGASSLSAIGIAGGIFQLFNHGIITAALFMLAGTVKHSAGTRDIPKLRGLGQPMPMFSFVLMVSFFASLGLPGLNSFVSEFMVFTGAYTGVLPWRALILIPLTAVVLAGAYYVWTMHQMIFGAFNEALGKLHDLKRNEVAVYSVLIALMFAVGFLPAVWLGALMGNASSPAHY